MEKSDSDIPRLDLYRKIIVFNNKHIIKIYENHSKTIKIKMTNIIEHEILRRIQLNQPKLRRIQVKNRPPPRDTSPPRYTVGSKIPPSVLLLNEFLHHLKVQPP